MRTAVTCIKGGEGELGRRKEWNIGRKKSRHRKCPQEKREQPRTDVRRETNQFWELASKGIGVKGGNLF